MVTATFKNGETTATANGLEKYDYGQILRIKGLDLPQYVAVQFAASGMSEAMPPVIGETVEGVTDALIPNSLLRSNIRPWDYTITAYIYIVSGDSGKTEYTITMPVKWRPRTGDDHLDEDPLGVIGKAVEQVNSAATRAETAASEVETTAAEIAADREQIQTNTADISSLKGDIDELSIAVFNEELSKNKKIDDVHYLAQMARTGENVYIEPVSYQNWSLIYRVKTGQKFEVKTYCTTSDYLSGIVFFHSDYTPQKGERYKAIEFNNLGITNNGYAIGTVEVPDGANYMAIRDYGHTNYEEVIAYAKPYELVSKIPTKNSELENDSNYYVDNGDIAIIKNEVTYTKQEYISVDDSNLVKFENTGAFLTWDEVDNGYTTSAIEGKTGNNYIIGTEVTPGEKLLLKGISYYNDYTGAGFVFSKSDDVLPQWQQRIEIVNTNQYDCYGGNKEKAWKHFAFEITVPDSAKYVWVRGDNEYEPKVYKLKDVTVGKVKDLETEVHHIKQNIFNIKSVGSVNVGTLEDTGLCKNNNGLKVWKFNETGKITFENVYVPKVSENDTLGIWIWCNQAPCSISDNLDGNFNITIGEYTVQKNIGYDMHNGWNYFVLDNYNQDDGEYTLEISFTLVRGDYEFVFDSFELNYRRKSHVLLSFDSFEYDNRVSILDEYGMVATVANIQGLTDENISELLSKGWDWAIYPSENKGGTTMPSYSGTVDEWVNHFKAIENYLATKGLMCPMTLFANTNRVNPVVNEALKKCGYKMARGGTSKPYIDSVDKTGMCVGYIGIGGTDTAESILTSLDNAISRGYSICIFTHWVEDTVTKDYNCSTEVFRGVLDGIKERISSNKCDVITFRELYSEFEPSDCMEFLEVRHEKEKQYVLSKITTNN